MHYLSNISRSGCLTDLIKDSSQAVNYLFGQNRARMYLEGNQGNQSKTECEFLSVVPYSFRPTMVYKVSKSFFYLRPVFGWLVGFFGFFVCVLFFFFIHLL